MKEIIPPSHPPRALSRTALELFHFLGTLASVTGVSLLWLKDRVTIRPEDIVAVAISVAFVLGVLTAAGTLIWRIYLAHIRRHGRSWTAVYFLIGSPVMIFIAGIVLLLVNKFMINFPFDWFFR